MPFLFHGKLIKGESSSLESLDTTIVNDVLPNLIWRYGNAQNGSIPLLPNARPSLLRKDSGSILAHNGTDYFVVSCLLSGLSYSEIGTWLDFFCSHVESEHNDGLKRIIVTHQESIIRLDRRKPIYYYKNIPRSYFVC